MLSGFVVVLCFVFDFVFFFFFKQKTAYEMRISDWSSDVCSSDLANGTIDRDPATGEPVGGLQEAAMDLVKHMIPPPSATEVQNSILYVADHFNSLEIGRASCRERVCQYV